MRKQEQEQDHHKQDVNQKKPEEMTKLERLQEENEYLRTEVAYLKKPRELRLKEASLQRRRRQKTIIKNGQRRALIRLSFKNG
ncbi:transposase [Streptococcus pyogenes]|uniref:transposase n=1 Tax=Streptococcus pyogenes TaxID=1314 RepID=UPI001880C353|nr:transposase [Streptococcus pyogenes]